MTKYEQIAKKAIAKLEQKFLVDGKLITSKAKKNFPVIYSATMTEIGKAVECSAMDVDMAIKSSISAQESWKKVHPRDRGKLLAQCARELEKYKDELAAIMTLETSKAIRTESLLEVAAFSDILDFYAGLGSEIKGETVPLDTKMLTYTVREPLGVIAGIIPWNVPLMLMALKISPALMAGNAVVIKSSENAPFAVLRACEIMNQILPKGVFNMISGMGATVGEALVKHPLINKVTFTGSVITGRRVNINAADKIIPTTFELGGKSPMVICEDVDLEKAVEGAIYGMRYTRQGQSCSAASRIYVHESIYDIFVKKVTAKLNKLIIGDPFDEKTDVGAVISQKQYDMIKSYLDFADKSKSIKKIICSKLPTDKKFSKGLFLQPTLITNIDNNHKLVQEEIFGPVCCIQKWNNFDKVLVAANQSSYGLTASIWTQDITKALRGVNELDAGVVQVNQCALLKANLPYGGFKNSGLGQEATKEAMLDHFTKRKTIIINLQ